MIDHLNSDVQENKTELHRKFYNNEFTFLDFMLLTSGPIEFYYMDDKFTDIIQSISRQGLDFLNVEYSKDPIIGREISKTIIVRLKRLLLAPKDDKDIMNELNLTKEHLTYFDLLTKNVISFFSELCPEFDSEVTFTKEDKATINKHKQQDLGSKAPNNGHRLKALETFCPELMTKLHKCEKKEKQEIIYLITGVNRTDAYKLLFTADRKELEVVDDTKINIAKEVLENI